MSPTHDARPHRHEPDADSRLIRNRSPYARVPRNSPVPRGEPFRPSRKSAPGVRRAPYGLNRAGAVVALALLSDETPLGGKRPHDRSGLVKAHIESERETRVAVRSRTLCFKQPANVRRYAAGGMCHINPYAANAPRRSRGRKLITLRGPSTSQMADASGQ